VCSADKGKSQGPLDTFQILYNKSNLEKYCKAVLRVDFFEKIYILARIFFKLFCLQERVRLISGVLTRAKAISSKGCEAPRILSKIDYMSVFLDGCHLRKVSCELSVETLKPFWVRNVWEAAVLCLQTAPHSLYQQQKISEKHFRMRNSRVSQTAG